MKFSIACILLLAASSFTHAADNATSLTHKEAFYTLKEKHILSTSIGWHILERKDEQHLKLWLNNETFKELQIKAASHGCVCITVGEELSGKHPKVITLLKEKFEKFIEKPRENPENKKLQTYHTLSFITAIARRSATGTTSVTTYNLSQSC